MLFCLSLNISAQTSLNSLRVNGLNNPIGIDPESPVTFSWILDASRGNTYQQAFEVTVSSEGKLVWSSGKRESDNSTAVKYEGPQKPDTRYDWTVRIRDSHGKLSKKFSAFWRTGLSQGDWRAKWIGREKPESPLYFKNTLAVKKKINCATAYISAHGLYELYIGGKKVGADLLTPGWTAYKKRLQYQAYDITEMLRKGDNEISAIVAPGWYSGGMNYAGNDKRFRYGEDIALLAQINLEYGDGSREQFFTDGKWKISEGPVAFANIYDGQTIDRTRKFAWLSARELEFSDKLVATVNEPVRDRMVIKPVRVLTTPKGEKVIDFGQNIVGWERATLRGRRGQKVTVRHAEVLDEKGNFYTINLRGAKTTSTYVLDGGEAFTYEPRFTFYGFRYISVDGLEGELNPDDFEAVAISSGFEDIGWFESSNSDVNQLQSNISWSFHDNYVDIPTDCPQRDERLGWTGDAQVFFRTASFLGRVDNFFNKWLADMALEQKESGVIPKIVPNTFPDELWRDGATGWADAATIIPWQQYMAYGNIAVLEKQYDCMKKWVDFMINLCKENDWIYNQRYGTHYGDWVFYSVNNDTAGKSAVSNKSMIAQCFFAGSAHILAQTAKELGRDEDAEYYQTVFENARRAFQNEYVTPNGLVASDTQTSYVLALHFNLLPESMKAQAVERLVANIERYKDHLTTGFLGTPYICNVLTDNGRSDVAYRLLLQKTCPSWLYPVTLGATSIWERWDSMNKDGSIPNNGMNSFNHYASGAIGDWLYRSAVGIRETSPGYKTFSVEPHVGGGFTHMSASTISPYGRIYVKWTAAEDRLTSLEVEVPANTTCTIRIPGREEMIVGSGKYIYDDKL